MTLSAKSPTAVRLAMSDPKNEWQIVMAAHAAAPSATTLTHAAAAVAAFSTNDLPGDRHSGGGTRHARRRTPIGAACRYAPILIQVGARHAEAAIEDSPQLARATKLRRRWIRYTLIGIIVLEAIVVVVLFAISPGLQGWVGRAFRGIMEFMGVR